MTTPKERPPSASTAGPRMYGDGGFQRLLVKQNEEHRQQLERARRLHRWNMAALVTGMVASVVAGVLSIGYDYYSRPHDTLIDRITALTKSLNNSTQIISDIEQEVNRRQALLTKLQQDADEAQNLAALNSAQASAVVQALRGELDRETSRGWWSNIIQGLIFAVLGAVFGVAASELWRRLRPRGNATAPFINNPDGDTTPPDA